METYHAILVIVLPCVAQNGKTMQLEEVNVKAARMTHKAHWLVVGYI